MDVGMGIGHINVIDAIVLAFSKYFPSTGDEL